MSVFLISGNWETATSDAGGLTLEDYELKAILPAQADRIIRLAFDSDLGPVTFLVVVGEVVLIVGHSFGARTALMLAALLDARGIAVNLILLDPVRWEPDNAWAQFFPPHATLTLPKNVISCRVFVRSEPLGPVHFHVETTNGETVNEETVPNTDHVSIIKATNDIVLDMARQLFPESA